MTDFDFIDDMGDSETLDGFFEWLSELQDEYFSEPRFQIINPKRLQQFQYALYQLTKIAQKTTPDAKIEYTLNKDSNVGIASITIETDEFVADSIAQFISSIQFATNLEVYPLKSGNIKIGITFYGMMEEIPKQTD